MLLDNLWNTNDNIFIFIPLFKVKNFKRPKKVIYPRFHKQGLSLVLD